MFKPYVSFSQLSYSFIFFFFYIPFSTGSKKPLLINYLPPSQSATIEQPSPQALRQAPTILFLVCDINHPYRNMADHILLEDIFEVKQLDPDGKKFDKVSRIVAVSQQFELGMQLDVNTEVYPLRVDDKFTMALAPTLSPDGTPDTGYYMPGARKSLADKYEYVMHGKLYKIAEDSSDGKVKVEVYASFGGLLMQLRGEPSHLTHFELDQRIFLLMRKV